MKALEIDGVSRRRALQRGFGAIARVAVFWAVAHPARAAAPAKLAKATVQYTDAGQVPGKTCDDCGQFIAGKTSTDRGTCKIVEGDVDPHGHCIAFTPLPKR
jgi:hypothetical protein